MPDIESDPKTGRVCEFPDCIRKHEAKGLCQSHYMQRRRGGELTPVGEGLPLSVRLSANSQADGQCIVWTGALNRGGYGQVTWHGQRWYVHRAAYSLEYGSIPEGMEINHICGRRACIKLAHLEPVDRFQNAQYLTRALSSNTSGYRGVTFNKAMRRYKAQVVADGVHHHLGYFVTAEEAGRAATDARAHLHSLPDFQSRFSGNRALTASEKSTVGGVE